MPAQQQPHKPQSVKRGKASKANKRAGEPRLSQSRIAVASGGALLAAALVGVCRRERGGGPGDDDLGGWPTRSSRLAFTDGHAVEIERLSDAPDLVLVRGLLTADEAAPLQRLFADNFARSKDVSKQGERNATRMWVPPRGAAELELLDARLVELCAAAAAPGEGGCSRGAIETGYFASYAKPVGTPIFSLHNDNHARAMASNPRLRSLVLFLNEPDRNALTVFPLARRLGRSADAEDTTDALAAYMHHERQPPPNAVAGSKPEPYWRFITRQFDHDLFARRPPHEQRADAPARAASEIYRRAEAICAAGAWDGLRPRVGDAAFFRSGSVGGGPEPRSLHASCGDTGAKVVLSKFMRANELSEAEIRSL